MSFDTVPLSSAPYELAPDGSKVRPLHQLPGGSMAHFELPARATSIAVFNSTVDEIWFFLSGIGEMWRKEGVEEQVVDVQAGVSVTIPHGVHFQFRSLSDEPLCAIGQTMPPWPGEAECVCVVGPWQASGLDG